MNYFDAKCYIHIKLNERSIWTKDMYLSYYLSIQCLKLIFASYKKHLNDIIIYIFL